MNYRDTLLIIDMKKAFFNIEKFRELNPKKKVKAVVKANAYGHGLVGFSYLLEKYDKVESFCVACLDEALALRNKGLKKPILVMGAVDKRHFDICLEKDISVTVFSEKVAKDIIDFNKPIKIQFKIDTGMNRIGFIELDEFNSVLDTIKKTDVIIEGIYSHFSSAEDDDEFSKLQIEKFKKFIANMPKDVEIHLQNSPGAINYANLDFTNAIRLGLSMYGVNPVEEEYKKHDIKLKEIITLKSRIVMVKKVLKGETVSYNRTYTFDKDTLIGTIPLGYADGFKATYNKSHGYIKEGESIRKFPIRGKICMDQIMIEVDNKTEVGEYVTFIGSELPVSKLSKEYGIFEHEILISLSERLYKQYVYDDEVIFEENQILKE